MKDAEKHRGGLVEFAVKRSKREMTMSTLKKTLGALAAVTLVAACGNSLSTGTIRTMDVLVDDQTVDLLEAYYGESYVHTFPLSVQQAVYATVEMVNQGSAPVTLNGIDWDRDDSNVYLKNDNVEIVWGNNTAFPIELAVGETYSLQVKYEPPAEAVDTDDRVSVLLIESDTRDRDGTNLVPEIRVNFEVPVEVGAARVDPPNYTYETATPTSPGEHTFYVTNDCATGTASFRVAEIELESFTNEFKIISVEPYLPYSVPPGACGPGDAGVLSFTVRYTPTSGGNDYNAVLVWLEDAAAPLRVPIESDTVLGSWSLDHENKQNEMDFSTSTTQETRSVILQSNGPGVLKVKEPEIQDELAAETFSYVAYVPKTSADGEDELVTSWPRALANGKTLRFDVTYTPPADPEAEPHNGQMLIEVGIPDPDTAVIPLFAGEPKGKLTVEPKTMSVAVSAAAADKGNACDNSPDSADVPPCSKPELCEGGTCAADSGVRHVVLYNEGNGNLEITSLALEATFGPPAKNFELKDEDTPALPLILGPNELKVLKLHWSTSQLADLEDGDTDRLIVTYVNPYTGPADEIFNLTLFDRGTKLQPTAAIKSEQITEETPEVTIGTQVFLDGGDSYGGDYELQSYSYVWYLVEKPEGSKVQLNEQEGIAHPLTPDRPGTYVVEMLVTAYDGSDFVVSAPVQFVFSAVEE